MLKMSAHLHQDIRESSIPTCSLDATESMVCYHILPTDRLECRVSVYVGQLQITAKSNNVYKKPTCKLTIWYIAFI